MNTILISGNDTGIGKTWLCRALANYLEAQNQRVQIVKVVETGVPENQQGDAATAIEDCKDLNTSQAFTLFSFPAPLAPVTAAKLVGTKLTLENIIDKIKKLPVTDWRILETAGGLAVPLEATGLDTTDLALQLSVNYLLLVVQNRLGTIHQARVLADYAPYEKITSGIWLNDTSPIDKAVTDANYTELANLPIPIWGHQLYQSRKLNFFESFAIAHQFISVIKQAG